MQKKKFDRIIIQKKLGHCNDVKDLMIKINVSYLSKRALRYPCDTCLLQNVEK